MYKKEYNREYLRDNFEFPKKPVDNEKLFWETYHRFFEENFYQRGLILSL